MPVLAYPELKTADGPVENLRDVMARFKLNLDDTDITAMNVTGPAPVSCPLAVTYGNLSNATSQLYDTVFVAIAGVVRTLSRVQPTTFDQAKAALMQSSLLEPLYDDDKDMTCEHLIKIGGTKKLQDKNGQPTEKLRKEVSDWFRSVVIDNDVIKDCCVDTDILARVLANAPKLINKAAIHPNGEHQYIERKLVDIGVLRMPDNEHPHFKMYILEITLSTDCSQSNDRVYHEKSALYGKFHWAKFAPRVHTIEALKQETKQKAELEGRKFYGEK